MNEDVHSLKRTRQINNVVCNSNLPSRGLFSGAMLASGRVFVAIELWKFTKQLRLMAQKPCQRVIQNLVNHGICEYLYNTYVKMYIQYII